MNDADFELIMAHADGETGAEESARAEALLAAKPEARSALELLRKVDNTVKASLGGVLEEPVPERLMRAARADAPAGARLIRFPKIKRLAPTHWGIAASLVLAMAVVTFWATTPEPGADAMRTFVYETLELTPSGERRTHPDYGWLVMPLASYETADGRLCREYAGRKGNDTLSGLACLTGTNEWEVLVSENQVFATGYQPASGTGGSVAVALEKLQAGAPLTPQEEAARLRSINK